MTQQRCFKATAKVPLRIVRRTDETMPCVPTAPPGDVRAAIEAADAFLLATASEASPRQGRSR